MSARFEPGESLPDGFRRVVAAEIGAVREALTDPKLDRNEAVHKARRSFKRLRAYLRLAMPALGAAYKRENRRWRDAGRLLAGSRDAAVTLETYDRIAEEYGSDLPPKAVKGVRGRLALPAPGNGEVAQSDVDKVLRELDAAQGELASFSWPSRRKELRKGLRQAQSRLKRSWKAACKSGAPEALHEWRKRAKDYTTQTGLFRHCLSSAQKARREESKALAEILGEEHDLAVLADALAATNSPRGAKEVRDRLLTAISDRRQELVEAAFASGEALSSQSPKKFAREIVERWTAAAESRK
jgi:CHAD domain-containing protein